MDIRRFLDSLGRLVSAFTALIPSVGCWYQNVCFSDATTSLMSVSLGRVLFEANRPVPRDATARTGAQPWAKNFRQPRAVAGPPSANKSCSFTTESPANKHWYYPFCKAWPLIKACPGLSSDVAPEASRKGHSPEEQTNLTRRKRPAAGQVYPLSADLILFCVPHSLSDTIRRVWN